MDALIDAVARIRRAFAKAVADLYAVPDPTITNPTIAVAMSGGVDSSVVAGMLHRAGQRIVGLTMQLWNQRRLPELAPEGGATGRCCSLDDVYDARYVAQHLGIPYYVVNFEDRFEEQVVKPFIDEYLAGRTPIPVHAVQQLHQVRSVSRNGGGRGRGAHRHRPLRAPRLRRATAAAIRCARSVDRAKDQTYFLFGLKQDQLARTHVSAGRIDQAAGARTGARAGPAGRREAR